ncbi:MAG: hypothetical protein AUJ96_09415 [Armatimonadetes bacterium CG2_30_66_41]|nr:hypothetical protein [Armatimonadota bacterium]OIP06297.1 MAG: hypothetical protein AUJ96_09415 [Armatimonadetes bacterium CG2_30_66_41]NCO95100.1 hypothetical protein [Armatimonadota bacterium]NCP33252.1 hypothetical protein [Armatimonadota bacterium]NCQ31219.1 hypothetical protein [Armatimonadota bacterium]
MVRRLLAASCIEGEPANREGKRVRPESARTAWGDKANREAGAALVRQAAATVAELRQALAAARP